MAALPTFARRLTLAATPAIAAALLAGCGGGGSAISGTTGPEIFEQANCASCHTFAAANATGVVGPNFDRSQPAQDEVVSKVTDGAAGMPAFNERLTAEQIDTLAEWIAGNLAKR